MGELIVPKEVFLLRCLFGVKGVCQILDWFEMKRCPQCFKTKYVYVLERVPGSKDLFQLQFDMKRKGITVEESDAKFIMAKIAQIAKECFERRVFHRDIKPENLIISKRKGLLEVSLIDVGCGTVYNPQEVYSKYSGTMEYAPPEWWLSKSYTGEGATVWSLGCLLYSLLHQGECQI